MCKKIFFFEILKIVGNIDLTLVSKHENGLKKYNIEIDNDVLVIL